jgi:hypothetical protein
VRRAFLSPDPRPLALLIGSGRLALGGAFLAAPVAAVRVLGVDSATAKRIAFLARMMAARDVALGAGTAASAAGRPGPWLLGGAFADAVDAAVLARALRSGRARGPIAAVTAGGAAVAAAVAAVGGVAALRRR